MAVLGERTILSTSLNFCHWVASRAILGAAGGSGVSLKGAEGEWGEGERTGSAVGDEDGKEEGESYGRGDGDLLSLVEVAEW